MSNLWRAKYPQLADALSPELNPLVNLATLTKGSRTKLTFSCENCAAQRTVAAKECWRFKAMLCVSCAKANSYTVRSLAIAQQRGAVADVPRLLAEWDFEKNELDPFTTARGAKVRVWWQCEAHSHSWRTEVRLRNAGRNCPYCGNKKVLVGFNDLATTKPALAAEWHGKKNGVLTPTQVVAGSNKSVWWKCADCSHSWSTQIKHRTVDLNGTGCPKCSRVNSKLEDIVSHHFSVNYGSLLVVRRTRPLVVIEGKQGSRYELDFLLPELKLAFEVQDFTSHSRTSDTEASPYGAKSTKRGPRYHALKTRLAREQLDVTLIELWEDEILSGSYVEIISSAVQSQVDTTARTV